jgi:hypothetical protein
MRRIESNNEYHSNSIKGSSFYKKANQKTLLHALTEKVDEDKKSLIVGGALHCAIFEPERFAQEYVVSPKFDRRTKEGKAAAEAFEMASEGKIVLETEWMNDIKSMKDAVLTHPIAYEMLTGGEAEYSYYAQDPETGVEMKCRPDYHNGGALIDLKSSMDASYEGFARQIGNLGYHIQAAFYLDTFNQSQETNYKEFFFVVVENKAPFAVAVYRLDETQIEAGRVAYKRIMKKYKEFLDSGANLDDSKSLKPFGYPMEIIDIQVPFYLLDKITIA